MMREPTLSQMLDTIRSPAELDGLIWGLQSQFPTKPATEADRARIEQMRTDLRKPKNVR